MNKKSQTGRSCSNAKPYNTATTTPKTKKLLLKNQKGLKKYGIVFSILLLIECSIAYFHFHPFVRGFLGDLLVIPLCYSFLKLFFEK